MKIILTLALSGLLVSHLPSDKSIHQFKIRALDSEEFIDFSVFKGKKLLLVNVASRCGYTKQYAGLEELYQKYNDQLVVIGFPCNQFLFQESGSEEKIANFCSSKFNVTFPMTAKIKVKGKKANEIYKWLCSKELNGKSDNKVKWNFNKFLLDENGELIEHFGSKVKPFDQEIMQYLDL